MLGWAGEGGGREYVAIQDQKELHNFDIFFLKIQQR